MLKRPEWLINEFPGFPTLFFGLQPRDRTLIPLVSGAIIEVVAGINFYLYGQATKQLATFQNKLDQMQRFLLANSICESLEGDS